MVEKGEGESHPRRRKSTSHHHHRHHGSRAHGSHQQQHARGTAGTLVSQYGPTAFSSGVEDQVSKQEYAYAVTRQVVGGLCRHAGFARAERSVVDVLSEVMEQYILALGQSGRSFTELAARTQSNAIDLHMAFVDLGVNIPALCRYVEDSRATLFEVAIPKFPLDADELPMPYSSALAETLHEPHQPFPAHVPKYLPPFPADHAYMSTPIYPTLERDPGAVREQASLEKRETETALTAFQARTNIVPTKPIRDDAAVLTTIPVPPYLTALRAQNGLKVSEQLVGQPPGDRAPDIVLTTAQDGEEGEGEGGDADTAHPSPAPGSPSPAASRAASPSPAPSPAPSQKK